MMEIPEASEDEEDGAEVEQKLERRVIGKVDFSNYKVELLDMLFEVKKVRAKMKTLKKELSSEGFQVPAQLQGTIDLLLLDWDIMIKNQRRQTVQAILLHGLKHLG